jgi:hypothetical protein
MPRHKYHNIYLIIFIILYSVLVLTIKFNGLRWNSNVDCVVLNLFTPSIFFLTTSYFGSKVDH